VCVCVERYHDILTGGICRNARDALDFGQLLFDHTFAVSACQRMSTQQQSVEGRPRLCETVAQTLQTYFEEETTIFGGTHKTFLAPSLQSWSSCDTVFNLQKASLPVTGQRESVPCLTELHEPTGEGGVAGELCGEDPSTIIRTRQCSLDQCIFFLFKEKHFFPKTEKKKQ
jgi:hypothetical protein